LPISESDRRKISRENALKLLRLDADNGAGTKASEKHMQPAK
jgi:hypothetical protein